ncbi:hypothetical protein GCM10022226_83290 [Sphaerisporangium flaviroseum]|uniref:2TM domain-containing protein n=1 Tax=Sphaerisporangium flaviroseum TaxID=509199 RepID=A0ABP7JKA7_9ACTN
MESYERAARRLMLAYPPRYRQYRGDELLATLNDLAEPGQTRPALRDSLDVIRGGIILRLREHPRLGPWLRYRLLEQRLPYEYRWWARDDLLEKHRARRILIFSLVMNSPWLVSSWVGNSWGDHWLQLLIGFTGSWVIGWLRDTRLRRRLLAKHEFDLDGTPFPSEPRDEPPSPSRASDTAR